MGKLKHIIIFAFLSLGFLSSQDCYGQLVITNQGGTAQDIVNAMVGFGLDVSNASISCPSDSYGTFTNGETTCANIPSGVLLSTGNLNNIGLPAGTQDFSPNFSEQMDGNGPFGTSCNDPELLSLEPLAQYDCCILEFDVVPTCNTLLIRFVFGSEEYPEYVNSSFNDAFGFFVSGTNPVGANYNNTNVATLPDNVTIVSVDNVSPFTNPAFYINNAGCTNIALDGLTTVLTREIDVIPCESYHFKLAIADAGDPIYDSGVFIDFLECVNAIEPILSSTPSGCVGNDGTATVDLSGGFPPYTIEWNTIPVQNGPTATGLAPGTYEVTVDDAGACTSPITQTVVVASSVNNVTPTFTQEGPFCEGEAILDLLQSSNEGITGSWSPAIDNTQTTTYTFTPDAGQCADVVTMDITIDPSQVPSFNQVGPYCEGTAIPSLSINSNEGIIGSWSPSIDNSQTTTYTFTPDGGQCSNTQTMEITIDPLVTPSFTQQGPYCNGDVIPNLNTTSNEGISGIWSPAIVNTQTTSYTFTPDAGQCSNTQTMEITIDPLLTPTFDQVGPYCEGTSVPNLNTSSNEGTIGSWSPAIDNTQTTIYTFSPDAGQCSNTQTIEIMIDPLLTPTFDQVGPYCENSTPLGLNTTSIEGVIGVWGPPGINTGIIGPSIYTFVPDMGQCSNTQIMEIIIVQLVTPSFDPVDSYCEGEVIPDLTTTSNEGLTGSWSPIIDNTQTTTYTFLPDIGQCANNQSLEIIVDLLETPTFNQQPPICAGDNFTLSTISNEGITGNWNPAINNTQTTPYTFTPDLGQCSNEQTMVVSVGPPETPTFAIMGPYCQTGNVDVLPLTSLEGFTGTWNPNTVDNTSTGVFTSIFTPDAGLCATLASIDITITEAPSITAAALDSTLCEGESAVLFAMDITGGQLVETFTMDVTAPVNYTTSNTNAAGSYYVVVSGTITAMFGEIRDANYQFIFNNNPVNPPVPGSFWQWNGTSAASQSTVPFVYNPAHVYNYFFSGGAPQTFTFSDSGPYNDNSGSLVFEIYYMGDLLWSTGATEVGDTIVPPEGNNTYTVSIDFGNGCVASDEVDVLVNALDSPTFDPIPPICVGDVIVLPVTSIEGYTGIWSPVIDNTQTTEYTFTPDAGQCASEQFVTVEVGPPSTPTFDEIPAICSGIEISLPSESLEGFTGTWSPVINNLVTTTYTYTPDADQCALTTDLTVEVLENPIISTGDPVIACIGDIVTLFGSGAGSGGTYSWDNGVEDGVSFTVTESLLYTVIGTDENGCIGTATILVTGLPVPIAGISASPESGGVPLDVIFTNTSQNATNYQWDFGNDESAVVNDESAQNSTYLDFGSYTIWLIADNGFCDDSISIVISTTVEPQIFVPNVFTPNADGSNEIFMISTENMQSIELLIVNRWGNLMATIDDLNAGWDGITPGGSEAKEGVYFYRYSATGLDGSEWVGHGFFSLVR
ncbi:choice-of-anchor L domain-containing protein [Crocinitomicaceae bacterium]|nr:choice-of-anchor L domain-containing protein [Crocinitomicaceae bacterium]